MPPDNYLLFIIIAVGYIASPGPAVFIALNGGLVVGAKRTAMLLAGNTAGLGILATISALGVGAFILNSAQLTAVIKFLGALWLAYLGIKMIRASHATDFVADKKHLRARYADASWASKFRDGLVLALTNPKPIVFFTSIYPQFVVADGLAAWRIFLLLGATFLLLSFALLNLYSVLSAVIAKKWLNQNTINTVNRLFGGLFILLALLLIVGGAEG